MLIVGGWDEVNYFSSSELYDPVTGTSIATDPLNFTRADHTATLLPNGKVLVSGGSVAASNSAEIFDPTSGTWTTTSTLNITRVSHTATLLANGKVLVAGGSDFIGNALSSTETYIDVPTNTLFGAQVLPSGAFQFGFSNTPNMNFDAWATTNLSLPLSNWTALGGVTEISPGQFQFTDSQATNSPQRFYRVRAN